MLFSGVIRSGFVSLLIVMGASSTLEASKRIVVDLSRQIAIAYQDGKVLFYGRISSGKLGHETPTGSYRVREKDVDHVSNLWPRPNGGALMPYMLRITRDGVAMHLGNTPNYPASHGCIRMQNGFAQRMYAWAEKWTSVDIIGRAPAHSPAMRLPAYARSAKVLRRSIGGGNRGPLAALSSNPKDHHAILAPFATASHARHGTARRASSRRRKYRRPLDIFGPNSKTHRVKSVRKHRRALKRKKRTKKKAPPTTQ
jgi:hypothetical protein